MRDSDSGACAYCRGAGSNMDHVHLVEDLPEEYGSDEGELTQGYAVAVTGTAAPPLWIFFTDWEPAWVFARSGRMAHDSAYTHLREAAFDTRLDSEWGEVRTLLITPARPCPAEDELAVVVRWAQGCHPDIRQYVPDRVPDAFGDAT